MNKKMLSRIMTSLLAGVMTVGMLAGCGNQDVNEKSKESESQPSKSQAVESTDNVSAEPQEITYPLTDAEDVSWLKRKLSLRLRVKMKSELLLMQ